MLKRNVITPLLFLLCFSTLSAFGQKEKSLETFHSDDMTLEDHLEMKEKLSEMNLKDYDLTVSYNAFSPMKGLWEIEVRHGEAVDWKLNNWKNREEDKSFTVTFLQDSLYEMAEKAYGPQGAYKLECLYREDGIIMEIRRIPNPEHDKPIPTDMGFKIEITDIKIY